MKKLLIVPALLAFALSMGACDDESPADPGPMTSLAPSEVVTSVPTVVSSAGVPSISLKPTTTLSPSASKVTVDPECGKMDDDCGNGTDAPKDGK